MAHLIDKDRVLAEINKRINDAPINYIGHQRVWAYNDVKDIIDTLEVKEVQEEPVSDRFVFKAIPRLLEMIEPTDRAKAYIAKLADTLEVEGYSTDAKIVRESLKIMNGEKVPMATMDEEPVSEDLEKAADKYSNHDYNYFDVLVTEYDGTEHWMDDKMFIKDAFIEGAKWKEQQFETERLKHCELKKEPMGEELEEAAFDYAESCKYDGGEKLLCVEHFKAGAKWQKEHLFKPADGDDLPEIDREVIALQNNGKVVYAHRPSAYWDGKNIDTGKVTRYYPKTYDKGGWNMPYLKYWLDVELPKEIKL